MPQRQEDGSAADAYDTIGDLENTWYSMNFDEETCSFMENQLFTKIDDTWGKDLIKYPEADTFELVRSPGLKYDEEDADLTEETAKVKELLETEKGYLAEVYSDKLAGLQNAVKLMQDYSK